MRILHDAWTFFSDEDGAVTVDWVVLTAALVILGLTVLLSVANSTEALATRTSSSLDSMDPASTFLD
ncbi:MAG: hypothetical protein AAGF74_12290 [Pseudomonadota bacterium]